ncbi:hypothetical protein G6F22_019774 [Rhizopus arrhizus]|nr:hypothetical protein G6F22_019774 [Rhizopus arrhizus]
MVGRAQVAALRHHGMCADMDGPQTVDYGVIADPGVVADLDLPRIGHRGRWPDQHLAADLRAEAAQQPATKTVCHLRRPSEHRALHHPPQLHCQRGAAALPGGQRKAIQLLKCAHLAAPATVSACVSPSRARRAFWSSSVLMRICQ